MIDLNKSCVGLRSTPNRWKVAAPQSGLSQRLADRSLLPNDPYDPRDSIKLRLVERLLWGI